MKKNQFITFIVILEESHCKIKKNLSVTDIEEYPVVQREANIRDILGRAVNSGGNPHHTIQHHTDEGKASFQLGSYLIIVVVNTGAKPALGPNCMIPYMWHPKWA